MDPTALNRQGNDIGTQYRSGIYFHNEKQEETAKQTKKALQATYGNEAIIVTEIVQATEWFPAERYHQHYLQNGGQCARKGDLSPIRCYG